MENLSFRQRFSYCPYSNDVSVRVSKRYRYRQRDEIVNEQFLVEEIYERELAMAEEYEEQNRLENDSLLVNIAEQNRSYGALKSNELLIN